MAKYFSATPSEDAQAAIFRNIYIPKILKRKLERPSNSSDKKELDLNENLSASSYMALYSGFDKKRALEERNGEEDEKQKFYRSEFRRDYARIIHSPSFRRLQGKTQLFPCIESDFFRNRLTHSLEVAQIAKTIAMKINSSEDYKKVCKNPIDLDLMEVAGLAHDLGHPPFGHQGEQALNECMNRSGGFEGNAQTLRLLSRIEKKRQAGDLDLGGFDENGEDKRYGLNLTYRALASILKYDNEIPLKTNKVTKGYYASEKELVDAIKYVVTAGKELNGEKFKTIECSIMDIADDIAYSTFDIEDAFKGGFITPMDIINLDISFHELVSKNVNAQLKEKNSKRTVSPDTIKDVVSDLFKDLLFNLDPLIGLDELDEKMLISRDFIFLAANHADKYSDYLANDGYVRSNFSSQLVNEAIKSIEFKYNENLPALSTVSLDDDSLIRIEILKQVAFHTQILSPKLKIAEFRGKEVITKIFKSLQENPELLPYDIRRIHEAQKGGIKSKEKSRVICDYIACMTDKYAIELYGRLTSETPATIFKPY